jgi:DNA-binding CsgD family transcriptional regulator
MEPDIQLIHAVWQENHFATNKKEGVHGLKFDEILSSIFSIGPCYFYYIDFFDMSLSHMSSQVEEIHGMPIAQLKNINAILALIHPDDMPLVAKFEEQAYHKLRNELGLEKTTRYKISYNFRFKTADGSYKLFNHQALVLQVDENGGIILSLNIHTQIDHITSENKNTYSLVGLMGEPSYFNINVFAKESEAIVATTNDYFSKRELQIIQLLAKGKSNAEIAAQLFIAANTVKNHRKKILHKANCKNVQQLIAKCMTEGLI